MTANLLSRLQGLSAPDREVDALIWLQLTPGATRKQWSYIHTATQRECHVDETRNADGRLTIVPELTASLDAAVALCERVLPGWAKGFDGGPKTCIAFVDPHDYDDRMFGARYTACAPTPAIALLIAILTALETRENG